MPPRARAKPRQQAPPVPAAGPSDYFDQLLEEDLVPGMNNEDVLDAISASETAATLKELNEKDTTPTPSRKSRKREVTPTLFLPTRLRMNVTPTKKAPPEMVKVLFSARKQRVEQEITITGPEAANTTSTPGTRAESVPLPAMENLESEQTRAMSALPMTSGSYSNLMNVESVSTRSATAMPVANANRHVSSALTSMPSTVISQEPQMQAGTGQFLATLQRKIVDGQQHIQTLQQQMHAYILGPGQPGAAQQLLKIQEQSAAAQDTLQKLLVQYTQLLCAESAGLETTSSTQSMTVGSSLYHATPVQSLVAIPSIPIPQPTHAADKEDPMGLLEDMSSISSPLKTGTRQRSLSQTLEEMGFDDVGTVLPTSLTTKSTTTSTATSSQSKHKRSPGLIISANDVFSKMGNKPRSTVKRSKTPAPIVTSAVTSELAKTSKTFKPLFVDEFLESSRTLTPTPAINKLPSAAEQNTCVGCPEAPVGPVTVSTQVVGFEPPTDHLFPGLPPFKPTDMSFEDLNIDPEDITLLPEELQQMLQEHEPLVDKKGGRPSSQTLTAIDEELAELDKRLVRLSKATGVSVASIMKRWNTTKTRGGSLWNLYQRYFTAHKDDELARLGLDPSTIITGKIRASAYIAFRDAYPTTWPEVLEVWAQYTEVENPVRTLQQRSLQFRQVWRTLCNLGDTAQRRHGFVLIAAMVGNEVHHDHSLANVYEAKDANNFFEKSLHANEDKLLGLLKTYAYNATANAIIAKDAEMLKDTTRDITVKGEDIPLTDLFNQIAPAVPAPANSRSISLIYEVKAELAKAAAKVGLVLNVGNLPWVNILQLCADNGIFIDNYPELAPIPCGKENGQRNKGVGNINKQERAMIIEALHATTNPMKFVRAKDPADVKKNVHPVLICEPPTADSEHACSKRVFANGAIDQLGHPRLASRAPTAAPPPRSKVMAPKSSTSTRSKPKSKAYVDITDEDDESTVPVARPPKNDGPARRTRSRTRPQKLSHIVESEDEDEIVTTGNDHCSESVASDEDLKMIKGKGKAKAHPSGVSRSTSLGCRDGTPAPHEQTKHVPEDIEKSPRPAKKMRTTTTVQPQAEQRVEPRPLKLQAAHNLGQDAVNIQTHAEQMPATSHMPAPNPVQLPNPMQPFMMGSATPAIPTNIPQACVPEVIPGLHPTHNAPQMSSMTPNVPGNMPIISTWTPQMMAAYATLFQGYQGTMAAGAPGAGTSGGSGTPGTLLNAYQGTVTPGMFHMQNPAAFLPQMYFPTAAGYSTEHQEQAPGPGNQS